MQPFPKLSRILQKDNGLDICVILSQSYEPKSTLEGTFSGTAIIKLKLVDYPYGCGAQLLLLKH